MNSGFELLGKHTSKYVLKENKMLFRVKAGEWDGMESMLKEYSHINGSLHSFRKRLLVFILIHVTQLRHFQVTWNGSPLRQTHAGQLQPPLYQSGPQSELDIKFPVISFANRLNQNIGLTAKELSPRQVNNSPALQDHARCAECSKHYYENQPWDGNGTD